MVGDLSSYAVVTVTPESDLDMITATNPLNVQPKLVRMKTTDRDTSSGRVYEFVGTRTYGAELQITNGTERAMLYTAQDAEPSGYAQYRLTASTIEIYRPGTVPKFRAGVTYTFHIYA